MILKVNPTRFGLGVVKVKVRALVSTIQIESENHYSPGLKIAIKKKDVNKIELAPRTTPRPPRFIKVHTVAIDANAKNLATGFLSLPRDWRR